MRRRQSSPSIVNVRPQVSQNTNHTMTIFQNKNSVAFEDSFVKKLLFDFMIIWSLFMIIIFVLNFNENHSNGNDNGSNINIMNEKHFPSEISKNFMTTFDDAPRCSKIDPQDVDYTLVTHSSEDRLWLMEHHCKRWGDNPISIAVLTNQEVNDIYERLTFLGCNREKITIQTINPGTETNEQKQDTDLSLKQDASRNTLEESIRDYPINKLRNMALSKIKTSHALLVDIDFLESKNLYLSLQNKDVRREFAEDEKLAVVIPAFQLYHGCNLNKDCKELNMSRMPNTKKELNVLVKKRMANIFDPTNIGGHGTTDYLSWLHEVEPGLVNIRCIKSKRYEPYVALRFCESLPPFQESFNGYGKNKLSWSLQIQRVGYKLKQLNQEFLIHYPHNDSKARKQWNRHPRQLTRNMRVTQLASKVVNWSNYKRGQNDQLYVDFRKWLISEIPDTSRISMCVDSNDDDSNLWVSNKNI